MVQRHLMTAESLTATVRAVAAGFRVDHPKPDRERSRLDDKRRQILRLLAQGAATRDISKTLCYSERTIKALIQDVTRELRAETRAQAVAEAIRQGLI